MSILVDSSLWICASKTKSKESWQLKNLIKENYPLFVILPIQVEVCQGAKTKQEYDKLWDSFLGFNFLEITPYHWEKSAWNYFKCRKQGLAVTTIDCLIATCSLEYRIKLWTLDKDFSYMSKALGFELFKYRD
jgi:predicted nucleic acid-binding protein